MSRGAAAVIGGSLVLAFALAPVPRPRAELLEGIAAEVGAEMVFLSEVEERAYALKIAQSPQPIVTDEDRRRALTELVNEKILGIYAEEQGIEVSALEVDDATQRQLSEIRSAFPDPESFAAALEAEGLTEEALEANYQKSMRDKLIRDRVMFSEIYERVDVSRREVRAYYETHLDELETQPRVYSLDRIAVPVPSSTPDAAAILERIRPGIQDPKSFGEAAGEHSEDLGSGARGGDLGWLEPGDLVEELGVVVQSLDVGQMSEVVRSRFGYHLVYVDEREEERSRVSHILRVAPPDEGERQRIAAELQAGREALRSGSLEWDGLAAAWSDRVDATAWGVAGTVERGADELEGTLAAAIQGLGPGRVTEVLHGPLDLGLVRLRTVRGGEPQPLESLADQISELLRWEKVSLRFEEWTTKRRERTYVRILAPYGK